VLTEQKFKMWLKRVGVIGFLFFLAKGLVWLAAAGIATLWLN
jgi:hypothetical protein